MPRPTLEPLELQPLKPRRRLLQDTLGRPLRDLRLSVIDRCNFRCPYCMPRERFHDQYRFLKSTERLEFDELLRLTRLFLQLGVVKLRITGGEPLLRGGLSDLIGDLTTLAGSEDVALTTNGVLLRQQAAQLRAAGLSRVTVSLDSLDQQSLRADVGRLRQRAGGARGYRGRARRRAGTGQDQHRDRTGRE